MVRPITVPIPPCRAAIAMSNLSETTAERIEQVRVRLHREDPSAQVRPSDEPGSIEIASILPHARVSAILHDVFGASATTASDDCCADEADGEGCCGCCGH